MDAKRQWSMDNHHLAESILNAEVERLRAENAALREIISDAYDSWLYGGDAPDTAWTQKARELLTKNPA